jgi:signal transduction histidine kinase
MVSVIAFRKSLLMKNPETNSRSWIRFAGISVVTAIALIAVYLLTLYSGQDRLVQSVKTEFVSFVTSIVESAPYPESVKQYARYQQASELSALRLWVVTESGEVLATNTQTAPPDGWTSLPKPSRVHDFTTSKTLFTAIPTLLEVKLNDPNNRYLLIAPNRQAPLRKLVVNRLASLFFVMGVAIFIALILTSLYLRKKSKEARVILSRLEKGDLKARFEIKGFDEIGNLMLDFNRMASEIEHLVNRVQETENTRRELLSELSHDLRTPLTSLRASVETMLNHQDKMPAEEQREFLQLMQGELLYFIQLIEDLFFIADMGVPKYQTLNETIDIQELLSEELHGRRLQSPQISWKLSDCENSQKVQGNRQLLQRLFKNTLDNAAKYTRSQVEIRLAKRATELEVIVQDNGPGISPEALKSFGQRRIQRTLVQSTDLKFSIGLGSIIMRTIMKQHGGTIRVEQVTDQTSAISGTRVILAFPKTRDL